jgi:hypothetical protein
LIGRELPVGLTNRGISTLGPEGCIGYSRSITQVGSASMKRLSRESGRPA